MMAFKASDWPVAYQGERFEVRRVHFGNLLIVNRETGADLLMQGESDIASLEESLPTGAFVPSPAFPTEERLIDYVLGDYEEMLELPTPEPETSMIWPAWAVPV